MRATFAKVATTCSTFVRVRNLHTVGLL